MGQRYLNATLTLVAAGGTNVQAGFLNPKSPPTCVLPLLRPQGNTDFVSLAPNEYGVRPEEPLYTRGWALQEYLLSPRLLIFGTQEIVWHCNEDIFPIFPIHRSYDPNWPCERFYNLNVREQVFTWVSIVENYTKRKMSVVGDRLNALTGIARELEKVWGDTYTVGLWRRNLFCLLLWLSESSSLTITSNIDVYPSWSWASVEGAIHYDFAYAGINITPSAQLISVDAKNLVLEAVVLFIKDLQKKLAKLWTGEKLRYFDDWYSGYGEGKETVELVLLGFDPRHAFGLVIKTMVGKEGRKVTRRVGCIGGWLPKD